MVGFTAAKLPNAELGAGADGAPKIESLASPPPKPNVEIPNERAGGVEFTGCPTPKIEAVEAVPIPNKLVADFGSAGAKNDFVFAACGVEVAVG
jgi:hypothetical protein